MTQSKEDYEAQIEHMSHLQEAGRLFSESREVLPHPLLPEAQQALLREHRKQVRKTVGNPIGVMYSGGTCSLWGQTISNKKQTLKNKQSGVVGYIYKNGRCDVFGTLDLTNNKGK